ncbi:MAG: glycosyltransferase [Candidatus Edwardsbacteria bacterium]|nr:glycosyltransferase [Candidatus Edwardsbacteria bacterium]
MADRFDVSVVVPTFNRCARLEQCLRALRGQDFDPRRFEIIVSDDGSSDGTADLMRSMPHTGPTVRYLAHGNAGRAANRNIGIRAATGRLVLFLDDDLVADPGLVAAHHGAHADAGYPAVALLGYSPLADDGGTDPVMRYHRAFWERVYRRAAGPKPAQPWGLFITNNLSLRRDLLLDAGLFDEEFKQYSYEDTELGYRMMQRGVAVRFLPDARAVHHVRLDLEGSCRQAYHAGRSAVVFWRKHPELAGELSLPSASRYRGAGRLPGWWHAIKRMVYNKFVMDCYRATAFRGWPAALRLEAMSAVLWRHTLRGMDDGLMNLG